MWAAVVFVKCSDTGRLFISEHTHGSPALILSCFPEGSWEFWMDVGSILIVWDFFVFGPGVPLYVFTSVWRNSPVHPHRDFSAGLAIQRLLKGLRTVFAVRNFLSSRTARSVYSDCRIACKRAIELSVSTVTQHTIPASDQDQVNPPIIHPAGQDQWHQCCQVMDLFLQQTG